MLECLVNGEISAFVTTANRGLNYADGLFETLLVNRGQPRWWQAHMDRLSAGCERLGLVMPSQVVLLREVQTVCAGTGKAVAKIVLTRAGKSRGYMPEEPAACVRVVSAYDYPQNVIEIARMGINTRICKLRLAIQPALGGIKHLNRLEQVLASAELRGTDALEGILLDRDDHVTSAVSANIFIVMDGRLLTPRLDLCGVRGVTRSQILTGFAARCEQRRIPVDMLLEAEEVFICNSIRGIVPVISINDRVYGIGPVTRELQYWLKDGVSEP